MHPDDAARSAWWMAPRSPSPASTARSSPSCELDDQLMPGVVSMVHGWGHAASPRLRVAHASIPGRTPTRCCRSGDGSFEPLSSQAHMTGIPVDVRPLVTSG
jgi:hypothetical protein